MATQTRNYPDKTLKILFGLSGDQCTHPECTNNVIEPATEHDDAAVIAQICHIYAVSAAGPRGRAGLTDAELKSLARKIHKKGSFPIQVIVLY